MSSRDGSQGAVALRAVRNSREGVAAKQVEYVQKRLLELGYFEVGEVDGKFGSRTRGALLAFKADHDLPLTPEIDDGTLLALHGTAPRVVAEERARAKAADLVPKSLTIRNKVASMSQALVSFVIAAFYVAAEWFAEPQRHTEPSCDAQLST